MEVKKSSKADLENKRNIFIQLGLVVALGLVFYAFNLTDKVKSANTFDSLEVAKVEEEIIPVTRENTPPPPPPPPAPKTIEQLTIVEDNVELNNDLKIENEEINSKTAITATPVLIDNSGSKQEEEEEIFIIVEKQPEFPGGDLALRSWLGTHVKYPQIAQEMGIQGKVYVKFVVDKDGSITNVTVIRGVDPSLDQEAIRVVRSMPKWSPGEQRGKPVKAYFNVPINFQLN